MVRSSALTPWTQQAWRPEIHLLTTQEAVDGGGLPQAKWVSGSLGALRSRPAEAPSCPQGCPIQTGMMKDQHQGALSISSCLKSVLWKTTEGRAVGGDVGGKISWGALLRDAMQPSPKDCQGHAGDVLPWRSHCWTPEQTISTLENR